MFPLRGCLLHLTGWLSSCLYLVESKVLQYLGNSAAFADVMKVINCEIERLADLLPLTRLVSMAWSMTLESMVLALPDLAWLLKFLQPKWKFLNYLVTVLGPTMQIIRGCTFICLAFKSHTQWSNTQHVSTPTIMILSTLADIYYGLNYFGPMIYISQTSMH